jgi:hypothetical protein
VRVGAARAPRYVDLIENVDLQVAARYSLNAAWILRSRAIGSEGSALEYATVSVEWDRANQTCVARPAATLSDFAADQPLDSSLVDAEDAVAVLLYNFVVAARQIDRSLVTRNLMGLYRDDSYRALALEGAHLGYKRGREATLADWKVIFDDFIDQLLVVTANTLDDPGAFIVGFGATAVQRFGDDPFAASDPGAHAQLNAWIRRARQDIWAGVVPPAPPELPSDDLAQAKAAFLIDVLGQVLAVIYDPPSVVFATLSAPEIVEAYRGWETAEKTDQAGFVSTLLTATCEPATLGYNLAYRHAEADVNTTFFVALHMSDWLPSPV